MTQITSRKDAEGLTVTGISKGEEMFFIGFEGRKYMMVSTVHGYEYGTMGINSSETPSAQDQYEMGFITEDQLDNYKKAKRGYEKYERERRERSQLEYLKKKYNRTLSKYE